MAPPTPEDFNPIHYIPSRHKSTILNYSITQLMAVAHSLPPTENQPRTNHWCFYLKTTTPTTPIIKIDCQPSHTIPSTVLTGGSKANLIISEHHTAEIPSDVVRICRLHIADKLRVEMVVDMLLVFKRFQYEFDAQGVGCRMWVRDQLDLLARERLLVDWEQVEEVKGDILKFWPGGAPLEIDRGAYYSV